MPSVDDLVISLKIDEGSNLAKLKKQLDALVGPEGKRAVQVGAGGLTPEIKTDLREIKAGMARLSPTHIPLTSTGQQKWAVSLMDRMQQMGFSRLASRLKTDVGNVEDIHDSLEMISKGLTGPKAGLLMSEVDKAMTDITAKGGLQAKALTKILKRMTEQQAEIEDIFQKMGMDVLAQVQSWKPYQHIQEAVDDEVFDILKDVANKSEKHKIAAKKINDYLKAIEDKEEFFKDPTNALKTLMEVVGLTFDIKALRGKIKTPEMEVITAKIWESFYENLTPILEKQWGFGKGILGKLGPKAGETEKGRIDIAVFGEIKDEFLGMFPQIREQIEKFKDDINYFEIKKEAVKGTIDQLIGYVDKFGENVHLITKVTSSEFTSGLVRLPESVAIIESSVSELREMIGEVKDRTGSLEEIKKLQLTETEAQERLLIEKLLKLVTQDAKTGEDVQRNVQGIFDILDQEAIQRISQLTTAEKPK